MYTSQSSTNILYDSCVRLYPLTQSPLAFWSAGGRQKRLWGTGILFKFFDWLSHNGS